MNFTSGVTLNKLRQELIRQEDNIIFALIERCQFMQNKEIYQVDQFPEMESTSFLNYFLHQVECVHGIT